MAGQSLTIDVQARALTTSSTLDSYLRLFDSRGRELTRNDDANGSLDSRLSVVTRSAGTFYVGVSGYCNSAYKASRVGSGRPGSTGRYEVAFNFGALPQRTPARGAGMRMMGTPDGAGAFAVAIPAATPTAEAVQRPVVKRWTIVWR